MKKFVIAALIGLGIFGTSFGQQNTNTADQTLRGSGRVNPSTLGMEFNLPLGSYPGRGINVPISLSYSSKVWRMEYVGMTQGGQITQVCHSLNVPKYSEKSASGWTTSLAIPYIEYTNIDDPLNHNGFPWQLNDPVCGPEEMDAKAYVRRISVHLPSGETHELRAEDTVITYTANSQCPPATYSCDPNDPRLSYNLNRTYYAVDGSNIKYIEDSTTNTFKLLMPDGSFYDFAASRSSVNYSTVRLGTKFSDRNGNFTTYFGPGSVDSDGVTHANGYWKDTLGRNISIPMGPSVPANPTTVGAPQVYQMPGMTGSYKLHWKRLKGSSAAESGLTNFDQELRYYGDRYNMGSWGHWDIRPANTVLFTSATPDPIQPGGYVLSGNIFNPIVLTEIELPTGQKYKFSYDIRGVIENISYPTGGEEKFTYTTVPPLTQVYSDEPNVSDKANLGVSTRKVYPAAGGETNYQWSYLAQYVAPAGYKTTITNPDLTTNERFLHQGVSPCQGCGIGSFGYDSATAGMPYEERSFDSSGQIVSRKLTSWTKTELPIVNSMGSPQTAQWHPRVSEETTIAYDPDGSGNAVSATVKYEYEGNLSLRETPVLVNKTTQYAFVPITGGGSLAPVEPGEPPVPNPTPVPTPGPPPTSPPVKIVETTYLINDPNYAGVKSYYTAQNMIGLVTASQVKDGSGTTVVSRSEMVFDESGRSPGYRGNPTTSKVWDSTKGLVTNPLAYISTKARFDAYGNQYEATDAKSNTTTTTFDSTHNAFPVQVTSPIPSDGTHGSNTAFVTTTTFNYTTGLPLTTTDANGLRTEIEYDAATLRPRFTRTFSGSTQVGSTSETVYHDEPNNYWVKNRSQIDENKWAESITYFDGLGRAWKSEQVDSGGNIFTEKEFDADGRVSRVTNPFRANEPKIWTTNVYDEASRVKEVILPDGAKIKTDYGVSVNAPVGVTKQITDQAGKKRKGITNVLGQMVRVIEDPTGQNLNTDYVFDTLGNLRKTIQGEQSRYFSHDSLGRLRRAKQPEQDVNPALALPTADPITGHNQWSVSYSHDDNGNIITTTDAKGVTVTGTYDNFNRLKVRDYSDTTMPDVSFYYDGLGLGSVPAFSKGKTTKVASSVSETRYTSYDNLGRLLTHEQRTTAGQLAGTETPYQTAYTYNLSGGLIEETYPSGRVVKNTLDQDGSLSQVQSKKNANYGFHTYAGSFTYNSAGAVTKMQLGNGRWETASYNNRLQITQIGLGTTDADQNLLKLELGYGTNLQNNGSLREQKITVPTVGQTSGFTAIQTYAYDDLNRIQSANETISGSQTWKQTFIIDKYGNRKFDAANTTTLGSCPQTVCNPDISTATNRLVGYGFDANGNVTQDAEGKDFVYDAENHQTEVKDNLGNTIGQYLYDGSGKRVKKISNTETTIFVYNAGGTLVAEYSTALSVTQQVSYLTTDHLGSPRVITDQNGAVTSRKDFTAFGEENYTAQRTEGLGYSGQSDVRKGYTGYEKDDESGLDFAQARYYKAGHGRYTSVDPLTASASIKNPQTFNRYSYVLNSPYKYTDPLGLLPQGSTGGCSAEFSSCDENGNGVGVDEHANRIYQTEVARLEANQAFARGDTDEGWRIIREWEGALQALDQNGNAVQDPNEPTVTVTAEVNSPVQETMDGEPLPSFETLWGNHPQNVPLPSKYENQCAIKLSYALLLSGVDMSSYGGATETITVNGNKYKVALRAYELWSWVENKFANQENGHPTIWSFPQRGSDAQALMQGSRGIVVLKDFWGAGQGHIDLYNGSRMAAGQNSWFGRSKTVILLDMTRLLTP